MAMFPRRQRFPGIARGQRETAAVLPGVELVGFGELPDFLEDLIDFLLAGQLGLEERDGLFQRGDLAFEVADGAGGVVQFAQLGALGLDLVKHGGGGHAGACGFTCKTLPFDLTTIQQAQGVTG